jgi:ectoine hydroxylase-related dioxygenase (phytanoyl-CoA dioxygenase family)
MSTHTAPDRTAANADNLFAELDEHGIVVIPNAISKEQLTSMQRAFAARLERLRWNNVDGYTRTELFRLMVEDVLTLDQGFVDIALHPTIISILNRYLGTGYELTEAKGWKSLPTARDFHGWHGDAWYEQAGATEIHREVKLAIYLSDVHSGAFQYIRGSHRKEHPRSVKNSEVADVPKSQISEMLAPAGTVFLFDTSGIHRQAVPMLQERQACFYNYHDPNVRLQQESVDAYRYHPLILNAAFLGNLSSEEQGILGFGQKANYRPGFTRPKEHGLLEGGYKRLFEATLRSTDFTSRIGARLKRLTGR